MKSALAQLCFRQQISFIAALGAFYISGPLQAAEITPAAVLKAMEQVADWQLANPSKHGPTDWTCAAGDAGFMALAGISGNAKYRDAMLAVGETNQWQPGARLYMPTTIALGKPTPSFTRSTGIPA